MEHLTRVIRRCHGIIALGLLALMFGLGIGSMAGDSAIMDEIAHIPAAYSYLHYGDDHLNPEHPPLIKDLASLPLQFMHLNFPDKPSDPFHTEANGEWDTGWEFLYHSGNNANAILFWARLPILLLSVAFGGFLYLWTKRKFGIAAGLLTLFFYALSPNIIAHSRFVTTDLGATAFMFVAITAYLLYNNRPTRKTFALLAVALAGAQLAKFSGILLYPYLLLLSIVQAYVWRRPHDRRERAKTYIGGLVLASVVSILIVWVVYALQSFNLTPDVQRKLIAASLSSGPSTAFVGVYQAMSGNPILRPLVEYLLGVTMVFGRVSGGNTTYFLGQITNESFRWYFPVIFLLKTQVAFLILLFGSIGYGLTRMRQTRTKIRTALNRVINDHFIEFALAMFVIVYFVFSISGNLNLGIRHILPVYPPLFVLIAVATTRILRRLRGTSWRKVGAATLLVLMGWYGGATLWIYPSYLAYFNELMGGPANAGDYFSDSSVDWGQDLIRLKTYMADHHITTFALDYFGGAQPQYYFGDDPNVIIWHSQNGRYTGQYIAVSETYLENDRFYAKQNLQPGYTYLREMKPIAQVGYSIYVFKLY